jgi:hypothetical protein
MTDIEKDGSDELVVTEDEAELAAALTALEMAAADDALGPIDYLVVEFPAGESTFNGEAIAELAALVSAGTIRLLDLVIVYKDDDGEIDVVEADDIEDLGVLGTLETALAEVLADQDLVDIAETMEPGSVAGVLVWENTWAAPFAVAVRRNGGQLISSGRIPTQTILASLAEDDDDDDEDEDE